VCIRNVSRTSELLLVTAERATTWRLRELVAWDQNGSYIRSSVTVCVKTFTTRATLARRIQNKMAAAGNLYVVKSEGETGLCVLISTATQEVNPFWWLHVAQQARSKHVLLHEERATRPWRAPALSTGWPADRWLHGGSEAGFPSFQLNLKYDSFLQLVKPKLQYKSTNSKHKLIIF
jgi:hypothetical protein